MLTKAQIRFLQSYIPELDPDDKTLSREKFIERLSGSDFDDGSKSSISQRMIARKLKENGLLSELEIHDGHIYLMFSELGASALYDVLNKYGEEE